MKTKTSGSVPFTHKGRAFEVELKPQASYQSANDPSAKKYGRDVAKYVVLSPDAVESVGFVTSTGKFIPVRSGLVDRFVRVEKPLVSAAQRAWTRYSKLGARKPLNSVRKTSR
jgi:hypothetical protein